VAFQQRSIRVMTTLFHLTKWLLASWLLFPGSATSLESTMLEESVPAGIRDGESRSTQAARPQTAGPQSERLASPGARPSAQQRKPSAEEMQREPLLRKRVAARWAALIAGDLATVYQLESPAYRKSNTAREHAASFGRQVKWKMATVTEVRYDLEDEAEVVVALDISFPLGGDDVSTTVELSEDWVFVADTWYHDTLEQSPGSTLSPQPQPQPSPQR
jgi:hypothetical protein